MQRDDRAKEIASSDEIVSDKVRLAILIFLSARGKARFNQLQDNLGLTAGNLASHLAKLEDAGYIRSGKLPLDARARVIFPTDLGLTKLAEFIRNLRDAVDERSGLNH